MRGLYRAAAAGALLSGAALAQEDGADAEIVEALDAEDAELFLVTVEKEAAIDITDEQKALIRSLVDNAEEAEIDALIDGLSDVYPDKADAFADYRDLYEDEVDLREEATDNMQRARYAGYDPRKYAVGWEGDIGFTISTASGNSANRQFGGSFKSEREMDRFNHRISAFADFASAAEDPNDPDSELQRTQKRWGATYQLDYDITDRLFSYGLLNYDEDEFSGFDYRVFGSGGLGYKIIDVNDDLWRIQGGLGYRYSPVDDTKEVQKEFAITASSDVNWALTDDVTLIDTLSIIWTQPTTSIRHIFGVQAEVIGDLATALTYEIDYETDPPAGRRNLDQIFKASLLYTY